MAFNLGWKKVNFLKIILKIIDSLHAQNEFEYGTANIKTFLKKEQ